MRQLLPPLRGTVSRGRNRASVRECPEQWGIPKFAGGKEPTGLFARMRLLTLKEGGKGMNAALVSKISSARRVPLRCGTQFAFRQRLIVLRMTTKRAGDKVIWMFEAHPSRNLFRAAKEIRELIETIFGTTPPRTYGGA